MKRIAHNNLKINIGSKGHFFLSTEKTNAEDYVYGYINTNLAFGAGAETEYEGQMIMPTADFFRHKKTCVNGNNIDISYCVNDKNVCLTERLNAIDGLNVIRQRTEIVNNGNKTERISRLSSACVTGIGQGGDKYFENPDRFIVYYSLNRMQGEGQWQKKTIRELGLYPASKHPWEKCTFRIQSVGSWATKEYYPLLIIEDTEKNECWFFEREGAFNWYIEINVFEGYGAPFINVSVGGADEKTGWTYDLKPAETYVTNDCFYGVVKGGFTQAVRELTAYKRKCQAVKPKTEVVFNDFMNCYWGQPNKERLIPLIDKASEIGCECFCIDDGWAVAGEWDPTESLFPDGGLESVIKYISDKGMRPGLWFEFEKTTYKVAEELGEDVILKRNGYVIAPNRPKLDLRNEKARKWLLSKIDNVYKMGVRYIKNDHNNDEFLGTNYEGENPAEGLRKKHEAFISFIKELYEKYPDLVIENCSAGGGRSEYGTLKYCSLQSITDQEDYKLMPSVISGCMAQLQPEKAGIWAYPYPLLFKDMAAFVKPTSEIEECADGRETIFNMISGMCGYLYLSGRLDLADKTNTGLIKEAIKVYKTYRNDISYRYPVFPFGLKNMCETDKNAFGLISEKSDDVILFVWALREKDFVIDLSEYGFNSVEKLYGDNISFALSDGKIKISADKEYSAIILKAEV